MTEYNSIDIDNFCHMYRPQATQLVVSAIPNSNEFNVAPYNIVVPLNEERILIAPRTWNDTNRNIRESGIFSVNMATRQMINQVIFSAKKFPPESSEISIMQKQGLDLSMYTNTNEECHGVLGVENSPLSLWCKLEESFTKELPEKFGSRTLMVANIVHTDIHPDINIPENYLLYAGSGEFTLPKKVGKGIGANDLPYKNNPLQVPQIYPLVTSGSGDNLQVSCVPLSVEVTKYPPLFLLGIDPSSPLFQEIVRSRECALSVLSAKYKNDFIDCMQYSVPPMLSTQVSTPVAEKATTHYWCDIVDEDLEDAIEISDTLFLFKARVKMICAKKGYYENRSNNEVSFSRLSSNAQVLMRDNHGDLYFPDSSMSTPFNSTAEYLEWLNSMRFLQE